LWARPPKQNATAKSVKKNEHREEQEKTERNKQTISMKGKTMMVVKN
jgi:hypothetical protein